MQGRTRPSSFPPYTGGEAVTAIGSSAFMGNHTVVSVVLPDTVTSVGDYAFYDCEYLETINLSDGIQSIGKYAFYRNQRLESFGEIGGVTAIEEGTFLGCVLISAVKIREGTRYVGAYAFAECPALAEVTLPDTVSTVGEYAFSGCVSMSTFHIPSALTSLGTGAFTDCPLSSVSVGTGNTVYSLDDGNLYTDGGRTLVLYLQADKTETSYETGTETTILEGAFANNTNLTSIVIGDGVTTIERGALGGAVNLQSLTVPYLGDGGQNLFLAYIFGAETALSNGLRGRICARFAGEPDDHLVRLRSSRLCLLRLHGTQRDLRLGECDGIRRLCLCLYGIGDVFRPRVRADGGRQCLCRLFGADRDRGGGGQCDVCFL